MKTAFKNSPTARGRVKRAVRRTEEDIFSCEDRSGCFINKHSGQLHTIVIHPHSLLKKSRETCGHRSTGHTRGSSKTTVVTFLQSDTYNEHPK